VTEWIHERIPTGPPPEGFVRNHNEKTKDMIRSILPSKARKGAREDRAEIHRRERARVRASLNQVARLGDADDFDGDLKFEDRVAVRDMVWERRDADKVAPLMRWAERTIATDPTLEAATYDDRFAHFAAIVPDNTIGRHALQHLAWTIGTPPAWQFRRLVSRHTTPDDRPDDLRVAVEAILDAGAHGDLNRRIKAEVPGLIARHVYQGGAWTQVVTERPRRLLAGRHDLDSFIADVRGREEAAISQAFAGGLDR